MNYRKSNEHLWLGYTQKFSQNKNLYVSADGEDARFLKWEATFNEPNSVDEHCVELYGHNTWADNMRNNMNDEDCGDKREFFCRFSQQGDCQKEEITKTFIGSEPMQPIKNRIIREFTPALNFKLSIDIQCSHDHPAGKFYNIFQITKRDQGGSFGDRVFAIWQASSSRGLLHINFSNSDEKATVINKECNDGEWNTYSLTHRQISNNPSRVRLSLRKDGNEIESHEMGTSRANHLTNMKLKVYFSHPWTAVASKYNVKNFFYEEYDRLD